MALMDNLTDGLFSAQDVIIVRLPAFDDLDFNVRV